jgi:hypothetical protein
MPPKKKDLTASRQRSIERQKSRKRREEESEAEADKRRKEEALRRAVRRENESEEESSQRKAEQAVRQTILCERETEKERLERVSQVRLRAESRSRSRSLLTHNIARRESNVDQHYIGPMDEICSECHSINFKDEKPSDDKFSLCCHKGKVKIEPLGTYPELLKALLTDKKHPNYANFIENIRSYNSALAFASMGASIASPPGYGPYCFRIHGQIYHRPFCSPTRRSHSKVCSTLHIRFRRGFANKDGN